MRWVNKYKTTNTIKRKKRTYMKTKTKKKRIEKL